MKSKNIFAYYAPVVLMVSLFAVACVLDGQMWYVVYQFGSMSILLVSVISSFIGWLMGDIFGEENKFSSALVFCVSLPLFLLVFYLYADKPMFFQE